MGAAMIGFIGVGHMGAPMARRLMAAGHRLVVLDVAQGAVEPLVQGGAERASSPADVASRADLVMLCLPTPDSVRTVVLGESGLVKGGKARTVVDFSTTGPSVAKVISAELEPHRIDWVDSPISGGPKGAEKGSLTIIASGQAATIERLGPIYEVLGKVYYVGEKAGLAQSAKLANNLLSAAALVMTSEAMAMAVKSGVDAQVMIDILNVSSGRNTATEDKFPRTILSRSFDFGFPIGLSYKDVRLCIEEAEAMGIPMVAASAIRQVLGIAKAKFGAEADFTNIARVVEDWADIAISSKGQPPSGGVGPT